MLTGTVLEGTRLGLLTWLSAAEVLAGEQDVLPPSFAAAPIRRHLQQVLESATRSSVPPVNCDRR